MRRALFELLIPSACPACDAPRGEGDSILCMTCRVGLEPWPRLGAIHTAIAYRGTGRRLVQRFKFEGRRAALDVLLDSFVLRLRELDFSVIVPIPRHRDRLREQRADPVHTLAARLAEKLGRPVVDVLERTRLTRLQSELRPDERRQNVAGSFSIREGKLAGVSVLLLDDIATTGATLMSAAEILRGQGRARRVECAALAGTPPIPLSSSGRAAL